MSLAPSPVSEFMNTLHELDVFDDIVAICKPYGVRLSELPGSSREAHIVSARHESMKFFRVRFKWSFPAIGRLFDKDHTTVMHGVEKISRELPKNAQLQNELTLLKDGLYNTNT